jgi:hypothetical protein
MAIAVERGTPALLAVRIRHQPGEPAGLGQLLRRFLSAGFPQQRFGQLDGAAG